MTYRLTFLTSILLLAGCTSIDKDRAAAQRSQELCGKIATQNLSHCAGNHIPPPPLHPDADVTPSEDAD